MVTMTAPDDALLRAVLIKMFADRQLLVDENLIGYLTTHIERSFAAARAVVATRAFFRCLLPRQNFLCVLRNHHKIFFYFFAAPNCYIENNTN